MAALREYLYEFLEPLSVRFAARLHDPVLFQKVEHQVRESAGVGLLDVVMVQPEQLFGIEDRRGLADGVEREFFDQLLARKYLLVPWDQPRRAR